MADRNLFPELPLEQWEETKNTLHIYLQIVGKIRLKLFPKMNHWWHVPFYVSTRGLTTRPIPYRGIQFEMGFDFNDHVFTVATSEGKIEQMDLEDGLTVAAFYDQTMQMLKNSGIAVSIWTVPYDMPGITDIPFEKDVVHQSYDREFVNSFFQTLYQVDTIFQQFRGRFIGKSTPPHLFWHHFDLALTRFSGRTAPVREDANIVEREAYSHEVISVGFWAGDLNVREPAFYGYAYPVLDGLFETPLRPAKALWNREAGSALYPYNDMRREDDPGKALLEFFESVYQACAKVADWDVEAFRLPA
jgi:hypothetical protein